MYKYNFLLYLFSPYLIIRTISSTIIRKGGYKYFFQRLGYLLPKINNSPIWLHAASIGETKIAIRLYDTLKIKYPETTFLITTTTPAAKYLIPEDRNLLHSHLPIDWFFSARKFIKKIKPRISITVETEIWPNFVFLCKRNSIPAIIVNGRLSDKTLKTNSILKNIYKLTIKNYEMIICKSDYDKKKFIALGADEKQLSIEGNLKFTLYDSKKNNHNIINKKYILAVSTHADEERQIITEWLRTNEKKTLLVIVPRHPERLGDILSDLPLDLLNIAIRSKNEKIKNNTQIYIADTLGEVDSLLEFCEFVFVGGSLVDHGGQNFMEAASYGKTIIVGPYMYNFISETEEFLKKNAMIMVKNSNTLKHVFERLLKSKQRRELFGNNAKKIIESKQDIIHNYCRSIQRLITEL